MADVLIVDDEEDICDHLREVLDAIGVQAVSALTGEEVLKLIETQSFKIFIIDLKLSTTVSGLDLIKAIKRKTPSAIVVAMSGYVGPGLKQEALRAGADDYFEKPADLEIEVFGERISGLLERFSH